MTERKNKTNVRLKAEHVKAVQIQKLLISTESTPNSRRSNNRRIETVQGDMKLLDTNGFKVSLYPSAYKDGFVLVIDTVLQTLNKMEINPSSRLFLLYF